MTKKNNKVSAGAAVGAVAGIAALTAAAYVLFGPDAKKNQKAIRGWAVKMKGEMIEKFEKARELTEPAYHRIVDEVSAKYAKAKNVDQAELAAMIADIRRHWKRMAKGAKPAKRAARR